MYMYTLVHHLDQIETIPEYIELYFPQKEGKLRIILTLQISEKQRHVQDITKTYFIYQLSSS